MSSQSDNLKYPNTFNFNRYQTVTATTSSGGAHNHSIDVKSGGSDTPITFNKPESIITNIFIYLEN